jgi:predicted dehydrogenase
MTDSTRREFLVQSSGAVGGLGVMLGGMSAMAIVPATALAAAARRLAGPVNVGLIGGGRQGRAIIGELQKMENVKIAAVCDSDESRASGAARRATGAASFTDHRTMLDSVKDLSAVIIATPTHLHRAPAVDCAAAGKHVYCEGPLAHSAEDAIAIAKAARTGGKLFAVGHEGRSNPIYKLARSFFRSDAVRDVVSIEAQQFQKTSWRFPATGSLKDEDVNWRLDPKHSLGLAGEWGSHAIDVACWFTEALPTSVRGHGAVRVHQDGRTIADTIECELLFPGGYRMRYAASLGNSLGGRSETFRGSNAAIRLGWSHGWMFKEADAPTQGWEVYANRQQFHKDEGITLIADATKLAEQGKLKEGVGLPNPSLYYGLWDFVTAVSENKPGAIGCDAIAGARTAIISIAAARAVATGTDVAIDAAAMKELGS